MSNKKKGPRDGRPPIARDRRRIALTIVESDALLLERICKVTGSRPATMIRELVEENRPTFNALAEAVEAAASGNESLALAILKRATSQSISDFEALTDQLGEPKEKGQSNDTR